MISLPNGCTCSELTVTPKNWETRKASLKKDWTISYRFYDPLHKDRYPKGKQRKIRVSRSAGTLEQKQEEVGFLISYELNQLTNMGFNLITGKYVAQMKEQHFAVLPETHIIPALQQARSLFKGV